MNNAAKTKPVAFVFARPCAAGGWTGPEVLDGEFDSIEMAIHSARARNFVDQQYVEAHNLKSWTVYSARQA